MRNLKKVLALVLALVMAMSLVTIANAANFSDSADISYKEAVDVMTGIDVIDGLDTGAFNPTGTLTREQAAKIICAMMLGEGADKLGTTSSSFSDVAATRWSSPYIEYCASSGIIAGNGDGTFNPTGKLTGYAFAKMLLVALGYNATSEGYVGAGWSIEVAKDAVTAGITVDGVAMSADLTREQATQMAFQTLEATTVEYKTAGSTVITPDGTQVITGGSTASKVETNDKKAGYDGVADGYVQFCETYFSDLKKDASTGDEFGRPGYDWKYNNDKIAFTSAEPLATFTAKTKESAVKAAIKSVYDGNTGVYVYTDGKQSANNTDTNTYEDIAKLTGNGVTVEVFAKDDGNGKDVPDCIVVINEYVGKITKVGTNDDDERYVKVGGVDYVTEGFAKGDYVLYTVGQDDANAKVIMTMTAAKSVEGEVTATASDYIRIDGTKYEFNKTYTNKLAAGDDCLVYLDSQGNILEVGDAVSEPDVYAYVKGIDESLGDFRAKLVLADGSTVTVDVDDEDGNGDAITVGNSGNMKKGDYVSYTIEDGVYTLTKQDAGTDYTALSSVAIKKGSAKIGTVATANNSTVFVNVDNGKVYTGYKNVPSMTDVVGAAFTEDGVATLVFIATSTSSVDEDSTTFFVADTTKWESFKDGNNVYYTHTVYVDGEETTLTFNETAHGNLKVGLNVAESVNDKDYITAVDTDAKVELSAMKADNATVASGEALVLREAGDDHTKTTYIYDDNTLFVKVELDKDGKVSSVYAADASDIVVYDEAAEADNSDASFVYVAKTDSDKAELATIVYIVG